MDTWTGMMMMMMMMMMRKKSVSLDWIDRLEGREIWGFVWSLLLRFEMCLLQVFVIFNGVGCNFEMKKA
ncbi:hypothetical protein Hanom_Chr16g01456171 [Helianthus anomalus]